MKKDHAKQLFSLGGEAKQIALNYFTEAELMEKRLPMSWNELNKVGGFWIDSSSDIEQTDQPVDCIPYNRNLWPTKELAEAALAMSQLCQIRNAWVDNDKFGTLMFRPVPIHEQQMASTLTNLNSKPLTFPTKEMCQKFISAPEINKLLQIAKPLL